MNERIKELWETNDTIPVIYPVPGRSVYVTEQILEQFAELIVRECIDTVLDCSVEYTTRPRIAQELKQHFGVE